MNEHPHWFVIYLFGVCSGISLGIMIAKFLN